jgi:hypothetical protein
VDVLSPANKERVDLDFNFNINPDNIIDMEQAAGVTFEAVESQVESDAETDGSYNPPSKLQLQQIIYYYIII